VVTIDPSPPEITGGGDWVPGGLLGDGLLPDVVVLALEVGFFLTTVKYTGKTMMRMRAIRAASTAKRNMGRLNIEVRFLDKNGSSFSVSLSVNCPPGRRCELLIDERP
jgi:hypothetical protein